MPRKELSIARRKAAEGLADFKAGRLIDGEAAVAEILRRLRRRRGKRKVR